MNDQPSIPKVLWPLGQMKRLFLCIRAKVISLTLRLLPCGCFCQLHLGRDGLGELVRDGGAMSPDTQAALAFNAEVGFFSPGGHQR